MADLLWKQAHAVIDERTTLVCLHVAGQIQPIDSPYETLNGAFDSPPFHVHCRSLSVPYMEGFVNDMADESNAELQRRPLSQRDTRKFKGLPLPPGVEKWPTAGQGQSWIDEP